MIVFVRTYVCPSWHACLLRPVPCSWRWGIAGREKNSPAGAGDAWGLFLGVGDEFEDTIRVVNDFEVEPPVLVDPGLPAVIGFIILLGPQRGMLEILNQEIYLFEKRFANNNRRIFQGLIDRDRK